MSASVVTTVAELRTQLRETRAAGRSIGAVPTMGALHEGHLSLIRRAQERTDHVVVTIFVNPTQFGPGEDFERYPRALEKDAQLAFSAGANVVFAPPVSEMYPEGEQTRVRVSKLSLGLCGAARPGHFDGVATIVAKLFHVIGEAAYFFGEKDYQQLRVIERLARDLLFPVSVFGCPIVRESDGLAMSSRNAYLSDEDRRRALSLSKGLDAAELAFGQGERSIELLKGMVRKSLDEAQIEVDYVELLDAAQLTPHPHGRVADSPVVLAVAGRLGGTRLIDNVVLAAAGDGQLGGGVR